MSEAEAQLAVDRTTRQRTRARFNARLAQVKADLAARSVGGRIADKAKTDAMAALDQGTAVARESKGVIAGTVAALALWTFRAPLLEAVQHLLHKDKTRG